MKHFTSILIGLLPVLTMGCMHTNSRLAKQIERAPSYRRLAWLQSDATWMIDYTTGEHSVITIGADLDENFWHRWDTLRVWRSGRVERLVICPQCEQDEQWVRDE